MHCFFRDQPRQTLNLSESAELLKFRKKVSPIAWFVFCSGFLRLAFFTSHQKRPRSNPGWFGLLTRNPAGLPASPRARPLLEWINLRDSQREIRREVASGILA